MAIAQLLNVPSALQDCIDLCLECHSMCERAARHCLSLGGKHAGVEHQTTMRDCAQLCATSADFMIRESPMHADVCRACAVACGRCEEQCRSMAGGDSMMLRCADTCARCAATCKRMSQM